MATALSVRRDSRETVQFTAEESSKYFSCGRACKIVGRNLTDEKVSQIMLKAANFITTQRGSSPKDIGVAYRAFQQFCTEQEAEFNFQS